MKRNKVALLLAMAVGVNTAFCSMPVSVMANEVEASMPETETAGSSTGNSAPVQNSSEAELSTADAGLITADANLSSTEAGLSAAGSDSDSQATNPDKNEAVPVDGTDDEKTEDSTSANNGPARDDSDKDNSVKDDSEQDNSDEADSAEDNSDEEIYWWDDSYEDYEWDDSEEDDSKNKMYEDEIGTHSDPLVVYAESDPEKDNNTFPGAYLTAQSTNNGLTLIMSGLTEANRDATINAIWRNYDILENHPIKLINDDYVDAEKSTVVFSETYDDSHCWAGSAANMLILSGWAKESGGNEQSEDEIMTFFGESFTNEGYYQNAAISYYMNNDSDETYGVAIREKDGAEGHHSNMLINNLTSRTTLSNNLAGIMELLNLSDQSIGLSVTSGYDGNIPGVVSHALTIVGVVIDSCAESIEDMFKAIIYSDSDNDREYDYSDDTSNSKTPKETEENRASKVNSYMVSKLSVWNSLDGEQYWSIDNWENKAILLNYLELLPNATEENKAAILDVNGTGNNITNPDLVAGAVRISTLSSSDADYIYDYDFVTVTIPFFNKSKDAEQDAYVSARIDLYDSNNNLIKSQVYYQLCDLPIDHGYDNPVFFTADITDMLCDISKDGSYSFHCYLNPAGTDGVEEAYYINNDSFNKCPFKYYIVMDDSGDKDPEIPSEEDPETPAEENPETPTEEDPEAPSENQPSAKPSQDKGSGSSVKPSGSGTNVTTTSSTQSAETCPCCGGSCYSMTEDELVESLSQKVDDIDFFYYVWCENYCACMTGKSYDIYLNSSLDEIESIMLDEEELALDEIIVESGDEDGTNDGTKVETEEEKSIELMELSEDICKLILSEDFMEDLEDGQHTVTVKLNGVDEPVIITFTK